MKQKYLYLASGGVRCLNCRSPDIEGGQLTVDKGGATQDISCSNCGSSWTDLYVLDTVINVSIENEHLKE
jgi:transcription elongation factor Elf1